ncbi:MAG: ABC transporter permease [Eubacteriales bacterium]|nr:ABC transporter permease [Eubacteriales bacterium]
MRKFWVLFRKELREMLTLQTIIPMIISILLFSFMGQFVSDLSDSQQLSTSTLTVVDEDRSALSGELLTYLAGQNIQTEMADAGDELPADYMLIPQGFEASITAGEPAPIQLHNNLTSLSMTAGLKARLSVRASEGIQSFLSNKLFAQSGSAYDYDFVTHPVTVHEITHLNGRSAEISPEALSAMTMQQSIMVPIIVFLLAVFGSQMVAAATANEKINKTLETLLTTPISRLSVLAAKMLSAAAVSLLMAVIYMVGFSNYMSGMTGSAEMSAEAVQSTGGAMQALGLQISGGGYALLGLDLFMTLLICLCVATMLGALANDVKSAQTVTMPLMILVMIPYLATIFTDISSLGPVPRWLLYAIPFTHTFTAISNIMLGKTGALIGGLIYQGAFLAVCLYLACRLFSSDKLFTMKLQWNRRRHGANASEN